MTTSLSGKLSLAIAMAFADAVDLRTVRDDVAYTPTWAFTDGTGANQAKKIFADTRSLNASANEELDLAGGLTDAFGTAITFTKIKALIVVAAATNTNDVLVGGAAANGFAAMFGDATDIVKVKPGGAVAFVAPDANGLAVTAGTGDLLKIANSGAGTSVSYTIILVGTV